MISLLLQMCLFILTVNYSSAMHIQDHRNYEIFDRENTESEIARYLVNKGYLPSEDNFEAQTEPRHDDGSAIILSKLSDEELLRLLNNNAGSSKYEIDGFLNKSFEEKSIVNTNSNPSSSSTNALFKLLINDKNREIDEVVPSQYSSNVGLNEILNLTPHSTNSANKRFETVDSHTHDLNPEGSGYFRLENKLIDHGSPSSDIGIHFKELQNLNNILYNPSSNVNPHLQHKNDDDSSMDEDRKEKLFDILVAQLKSLCCSHIKKSKLKKPKRIAFTFDADSNVPAEILKNVMKNYETPSNVDPDEKEIRNNGYSQEHMFLIMNDEINSNVTDELISVDPDSLDKNSSVLLLGPVTSSLSDKQLKVVMSRISNELTKEEYLPILKQISDGILSGSNVGLLKNIVRGPDTRRYIKPHRCNHQSKLAKVYGGPKWLICTGYLNINGPSLYD